MIVSTMAKPNYKKAVFLKSAAKLSQLPEDTGIEVAIVGRSNAGKSSVLNQITQNKGLARVSKTPGRTQLINLFTLDAERRLVDLPGYGYAKVPLSTKEQWQKTLSTYLLERQCLIGLILVMDIRHPLKEFDQNLLAWCDERNLSVHVLLNKADKLRSGAIKQTLAEVKTALTVHRNVISLQAFSAAKGTGLKELQDQLDTWYTL